jgi:hypothetical protein
MATEWSPFAEARLPSALSPNPFVFATAFAPVPTAVLFPPVADVPFPQMKSLCASVAQAVGVCARAGLDQAANGRRTRQPRAMKTARGAPGTAPEVVAPSLGGAHALGVTFDMDCPLILTVESLAEAGKPAYPPYGG